MLMKNFLVLLLASVSLISYADPDEIVIIQDDPIKNRSGVIMPLDQPCVYYDDETQTIIIYNRQRHLRHVQHLLTERRHPRHHHRDPLGQHLRGYVFL